MSLNTQLKSVSPLNFNQLFAKFLQTVEGTVEQHAPLKKRTRKQRKLQAKPWNTKGVLISIRHKQKYTSRTFCREMKRKNVYTKNTAIN